MSGARWKLEKGFPGLRAFFDGLSLFLGVLFLLRVSLGPILVVPSYVPLLPQVSTFPTPFVPSSNSSALLDRP